MNDRQTYRLIGFYCLIAGCALLPFFANAQTEDSLRSAKKTVLPYQDKEAVRKKLPKLIYIDNNYATSEDLFRLNPSLVEDLTVLKGDEAVARYGSQGVGGVLLVITKRYATALYQSKFKSLSNDYKKMLLAKDNNDASVIYILDGISLESDIDKGKKLCRIAKDNIESIKVDQVKLGGRKVYTVNITTKK